MDNKKGFLLGEYTLKIIIAVISLGFLVYLLFLLYGTYAENRDLKQAKSTLNEIVEKMNAAKEGGEQEMVFLSPKDWTIGTFNVGEERPEICIKNCVCLVKSSFWKKDEIVCENFDEKISSTSGLESIVDIIVKYENNEYVISKNENE